MSIPRFAAIITFIATLAGPQAAQSTPVDINQWLSTQHLLQENILWQSNPSTPYFWITPESDPSKTKWLYWSESQKSDLQVAYQHIYDAYYGSGGEWLTDMPPNKALDFTAHKWDTWLAPADAWAIYVNSVAQSLFVEIHGIVPWSLNSLDQPGLRLLLDSRRMFAMLPHNGAYFYSLTEPSPHVRNARADTMPATPYVAFNFLVDNGLLDTASEPAAAQLNTIENLVEWSSRLGHWIHTPNDPDYRFSHWQYAGLPPPSRIIQGTYFDNPNDEMHPFFQHWTNACQGTSSFYQQILRAVNIPVQVNRVCGHGLPVFRASRRFITHGDNAYNQTFINMKLPGSVLLRPAEEFEQFFGADYDTLPLTYAYDGVDPNICDNVSIDPTNMWKHMFVNGFERPGL